MGLGLPVGFLEVVLLVFINRIVYIYEVVLASMGYSTIKQTEESYTIVFVNTLIHAFKSVGLI